MNPLNPLEDRMRLWNPRRPSARLKRRLFGAAPAGAQESPSRRSRSGSHWGWYWLAPATAVVLVLSLSVDGWRHQANYGGNRGSQTPPAALALSNRQPATWIPSWDAFDRNSPPSGTFEWTNTQGNPSSIEPFLSFKTNRLNR